MYHYVSINTFNTLRSSHVNAVVVLTEFTFGWTLSYWVCLFPLASNCCLNMVTLPARLDFCFSSSRIFPCSSITISSNWSALSPPFFPWSPFLIDNSLFSSDASFNSLVASLEVKQSWLSRAACFPLPLHFVLLRFCMFLQQLKTWKKEHINQHCIAQGLYQLSNKHTCSYVLAMIARSKQW